MFLSQNARDYATMQAPHLAWIHRRGGVRVQTLELTYNRLASRSLFDYFHEPLHS
jgi:hypothetical protein